MGVTLPAPKRNWVLVYDQHPDVLIERHRHVSRSPEVHAAYARRVQEKAEAEGLLYVDTNTGYQARLKTAPKAA